MDQRLLLLFLLVNSISVWSSPHKLHSINKRAEFFCGSKLSEALYMVCKGSYNSPTKKSMNDLFAYEYDYFPSESDEDNQLDFPFLERDTANSFLPIRSRRRRAGIVNECCRNPCTLQHLSLYCGS
jgi:insulin